MTDFPLQISFHEIRHSDSVTQIIRKKVNKLAQLYSRIVSCRVAIEPANHNHQQGNLYRVRISLRVPGHEFVVSGQNQSEKHQYEDVYVAIRDSFDALHRQLREYINQLPRRHPPHLHEAAPHGEVIRMVYEGDLGYGFLRTPDGREIYFNQNSVLDGHFNDLQVGTEVRYTEEMGEDGPQASTVEIAGRNNRAKVV